MIYDRQINASFNSTSIDSYEISSIFLHGAIVCRLTNPYRDILNQLQSHNKVCCNNLDRLRIWNDCEHKYCGRTCIDWRSRWSSYYIAFNDGTSMIGELSICKMDRIKNNKKLLQHCANHKKMAFDGLELFNYQDRQSNEWAGFSNGNYDYFKFSWFRVLPDLLYLYTQGLFQSSFHFPYISFLLN